LKEANDRKGAKEITQKKTTKQRGPNEIKQKPLGGDRKGDGRSNDRPAAQGGKKKNQRSWVIGMSVIVPLTTPAAPQKRGSSEELG